MDNATGVRPGTVAGTTGRLPGLRTDDQEERRQKVGCPVGEGPGPEAFPFIPGRAAGFKAGPAWLAKK